MKTLADLNADAARHEWGKYLLETRYGVARGGMRSGDKVHLVRLEVVVEDHDPKPGTYAVGANLSAKRACNSNGQHTGRPVAGWDTHKITCAACLRSLSR